MTLVVTILCAQTTRHLLALVCAIGYLVASEPTFKTHCPELFYIVIKVPAKNLTRPLILRSDIMLSSGMRVVWVLCSCMHNAYARE